MALITPIACYTCGQRFNTRYFDDYVKGVYIEKRSIKDVLDEITKKYKSGNKMNGCCRKIIQTHPYSADDIQDVLDQMEDEAHQQPTKNQSFESDQPFNVPLAKVRLGSAIRRKTLDPEDTVHSISIIEDEEKQSKGWKYEGRTAKALSASGHEHVHKNDDWMIKGSTQGFISTSY